MSTQVSLWTIALQVVNFLVLVWLLKRFLYTPVTKAIEKRRAAAESALAEAARAKADAEAEKQRLAEAQARLEADRQDALRKAHEAAEAERQTLLAEARTDAAKRLDEAKRQIETDRSAARQDMQAELADVAVDLAHRLLADIAASIPDEAVIARLEHELKRLPPEERQRIDDEIRANGAHLNVVTAHPIDTDRRSVWQTSLERTFNHKLVLDFDADPTLLAGAVLRLPHTSVRATWADQLEGAKAKLARDHGAD